VVSIFKSIFGDIKIGKFLDFSGATNNSKKSTIKFKGDHNKVIVMITGKLENKLEKFLKEMDDEVYEECLKNEEKLSESQKVKLSKNPDVKNALQKAAKIYQEKINDFFSESLQSATKINL
jgi:hypothetical protein